VALSKLAANSFDLTDNYAFTGTTTGVTSTQKLFLIKNLDASNSSTIDFVHGSNSVVFDSTYKTYIVKIINAHPDPNNGPNLGFQATTDGSNFNVTQTTAHFRARHDGDDASTTFGYDTGNDIAQGTTYQSLGSPGNGNSECFTGQVIIFNPSSTTFIKNYFTVCSNFESGNIAQSVHNGGYFNTTSALTGISFKFSAGNIGSGRFALYGIK